MRSCLNAAQANSAAAGNDLFAEPLFDKPGKIYYDYKNGESRRVTLLPRGKERALDDG